MSALRRRVGWAITHGMDWFRFLGRCPFRWLELVGQVFPEDATGCRIRGCIYRPFLKRCGRNFQVGLAAKLEHPSNIDVGDDVYIGHGSWISGVRGGIKLGDQTMLGPYVCMVSSNHTPVNGSFRFGPGTGARIVIGRGSWLAAKTVVTAGVEIGECCLIAAGAVVTRPVASYSIVAGVPAKKIGDCREKYP
jgi:maltose O-acetyltransferase